MTDYVSPDGGNSYGLQYPFRYKRDGDSWVVFSTLDGWVLERIPGGDWRQERLVARRCREVNGLHDEGMTPELRAALDAQE